MAQFCIKTLLFALVLHPGRNYLHSEMGLIKWPCKAGYPEHAPGSDIG